jgi:hypothetical protein
MRSSPLQGRLVSPGTFRAARTLRVCAIVILLGASAAAMAQALYRWSDADGKTHYGDRPPKGALNVTRIEIDPPGNTVTMPAAPKAPAESAKSEEKAPPDLATRRRALREKLEGVLVKAREKLAAAKLALAEAEPGDDERQFIQQRKGADTKGNTGSGTTAEGRQVGGSFGMGERRNCREVPGRDGQRVVVCPTFVPNEKFQDRVALMEEAVRAAELEVSEAEYAYRRGVD